MIARIKHLWSLHPFVTAAFALACAVFLFFAFNTITATIYWMDPAHQDQTLEGWMTPRYVANSYRLPPEVLDPALFIPPEAPRKRQSLDTIATENGLTLYDLQVRIDAAADTWRSTQPGASK